MMRNIEQITQIFDIAVPLLLYFVWDWHLHFIFLFVFIDALSGVFVSFLKETKIEAFKRVRSKKSKIRFTLYFSCFVFGVVFFELALLSVYPKLDLWSSFKDFLFLEEMGIPQFIILIPIIVLLNYQQYQALFIRTQAYQFLPLNFLQNKNKNTWLIFLIWGTLVYALGILGKPSPTLLLLFAVGLKLCFDFLLKPYLDKKYVQQFVNSHHDFSR